MAESRSLTKTGAELQDVVELLDQLTGDILVPFTDFREIVGSPAIAAVGGVYSGSWALDAAANEGVTTVMRIPSTLPGLDVTKSISIYVNWSAAATSGNVVWSADYLATSVGEDVGGTMTTVSNTEPTSGTADLLQETILTIPASALASGDNLFLAIRRQGDDGSDTMTGDANFYGVRMSYTTNPNIV